MKLIALVAGAVIGLTPAAVSHVSAAQTTTTKYVTVDGEVLRYESGKTIVVRTADGKEMVYALAPSIVVPAEVQVGRRVSLHTEPNSDGTSAIVTRVTTTSVTPEGNLKRTTETTRTSPEGVTTKTTTTRVSGTVDVYEPGKTLTITGTDGIKRTYIITTSSQIPSDLVVGKTVSLVPSANGEMTVQTITYVKPRQ